MTRFKLPPLGYDFGALEPHISAEIMELHHDQHHRAYVDGANQAIEKLAAARDKDDFTNIAAIERALAFNVSGHILHSIFWRNLSPKGGGDPKGALATAINRDFGNVATMRKQLNHAATTIMGSGWAALVWDPASRRPGNYSDPRSPIRRHPSGGAAAGDGRLGARLLPPVQESQSRLLHGAVGALELGRRGGAVRARAAGRPGAGRCRRGLIVFVVLGFLFLELLTPRRQGRAALRLARAEP